MEEKNDKESELCSNFSPQRTLLVNGKGQNNRVYIIDGKH